MFVESLPEQSSLEPDEEKIIVNIVESFERDIKKLSPQDFQKVNQKLDLFFTQLQEGNIQFLTDKLKKVPIQLSIYSSSLYFLKINVRLGIVLFFEDDPIFSQKIVTLLRVFLRRDLKKILKGLTESYYQKYLAEMRDAQ
ncbi:MAG: hypothetical protein AAGA60_02240 [Cyanobacteria bacterium P01_E01_bin.42]